ncbi:MAG: p-hydroxycinnamoyl CoA hydratase/lyase [Solirubrobacterales bacterium]
MPSYDHVVLSFESEVATLQLNRPEKKNALSPALHKDIDDALTEIEEHGGVKVLVVTGTDEAFSAGMDLEECFLDTFEEPEKFEEMNSLATGWPQRVKAFPAVTVAKVRGWCFGAGFQLAGLCDIVITAEDAVFGMPEINFGILPAGGTLWAAAHNMTRKQALYYALTGDRLSGSEAVELGMATRAVPAAELDEVVDGIVAQLANKNIWALRATKEAYEGILSLHFPEGIELEMAKLYELSYRTENEWIRKALAQFGRRAYRPGLESYSLEETS